MRKFIQSFVYAWNGICHGILAERNAKLHLLAAIIVILAGIIDWTFAIEWFIVIILIGGMLALEMMNSAIERVVDLLTAEASSTCETGERSCCRCGISLCNWKCNNRFNYYFSEMV